MSDLVLDLSQADAGGFEALPAGTYDCTVFSAEMTATKGNPGAKLPAGTPMIKVMFRVSEEPYKNRRLFTQYVIAPAKIDGQKNEKKSVSDGILASFLVAIGIPQEDVKSGKYVLDLPGMAGRACRVGVKKEQKYGTKPEDDEWDNTVTGVKPSRATEGGIE